MNVNHHVTMNCLRRYPGIVLTHFDVCMSEKGVVLAMMFILQKAVEEMYGKLEEEQAKLSDGKDEAWDVH